MFFLFASFSKKVCIFAIAYSRRVDFERCRSGYWEGALHLGNAFANACFWPLEPEKLERRVKDNAEVDAAGVVYTAIR